MCSCSVCDRHRNKANKQKILLSRQTHVSKGVQVVVGEFEFLERDKLAAPVRPCGGRVRMDVEPTGHRGLCLPRYRPLWPKKRGGSENALTLTHTHTRSQWFSWCSRPALPPAAEGLVGSLIKQTMFCWSLRRHPHLDLNSVNPNEPFPPKLP